jgi:hypothetical protein
MVCHPGHPSAMDYICLRRRLGLSTLWLVLVLAVVVAENVDGQSTATERHLVVQSKITLQGLPEDLFRILGFSRGIDSSFVLLNGDEPFIWSFGPTGQFLKRWGSKGSGPGEFRTPRMVGRRGDSIWVWDSGLARLTVFSSSGHLGRTMPLPSSGQATLLANGQVTVHTTRNYGPDGESRSHLQVRPIVKANMALGLPLFQADYSYKVLQYRRGGSMMVGVQPFEDGALFTVCADGSGFVYVDRQIVRGSGVKDFGVTRISPDGAILYFVRIRFDPVPLSGALIQRAVSQLVKDGPPSMERGLEARIRAAIERPPYLPTVSRVLCGTDGSVWLRREDLPGATIQWTILDERGNDLVDLAFDRKVNLMSVTRDHAWTLEGDENSVRAFALWAVR